MLVIPAVDIRNGHCVQLVGGKTNTGKKYGDPIKIALKWTAQGASYLHLVDLDAAMGEGDNFEKVAEVLANVGVGVEVGGGVRTVERGSELLGIGADRVILGTAAVKEPDIVRELVELADPSRVVVALDARDNKIVVEGWKEVTERETLEVAKEFEKIGIGGFLFTDVSREGRMGGVNLDAIRRLVVGVDVPVIAAGGVSSLQDVREVKRVGADALVLGTALYEGKITLKDAMKAAK